MTQKMKSTEIFLARSTGYLRRRDPKNFQRAGVGTVVSERLVAVWHNFGGTSKKYHSNSKNTSVSLTDSKHN